MIDNKRNFQGILTKYGTLIALGLIFLFFSVSVSGFVNPRNLINIIRQIALLAIIAEGFTMCLIVGELDLSFANVASLTGVIVAGLIFSGVNPFLAVIITLFIGAAFGFGAGLLVTKVGIPSLITTLATGIIATGFIYAYTKGVSLYGDMPETFLSLGRGNIGPIPVLVIIMALIVIIAHVFINNMKAGKYLQATGSNRTATRLAGINTDVYVILALTLSSLAAAFTGILLTSKLGAANPEGASGYMMDTFAAALLGQTVLNVGRGSPFGTFVGALMIGILNNGMTLAGAPYYMQDITKGTIIILSVTITSIQAKRLATK
ncbi:MAG TPA: ABC transporter permease [Thermotogota bacterium]|nr:ABC transporter permease [Thermotogota bacterium]HPJ89846.1 ABC transporter permease [Thermotogota bacterium]HPR95919.1 ABC transporter permease [Thermotogota bacterium]